MIELNSQFDYHSELWASERAAMAREAELEAQYEEEMAREAMGVPIGPLKPIEREDIECPF